MQQIRVNYTYNETNVVATTYQDHQIKSISYKAIRNKDDIHVILNIYKCKKPGHILKYYKRVIQIAQVKHQHLTPILDCTMDSQSSQLFVVLQWNQGFCLKEYLKNDVVSWQTGFNIIRDISKGLNYLHQAGIKHGFVNLQNIQIWKGRARLSYRYLICKAYYLAPQTKKNHAKNKEADLFSLGVCFYKLIFGQVPFKSKTQQDLISKVKIGLSRKVFMPNTVFPIVIPSKMQALFNTLCNFVPQERLQALSIIQKFETKKRRAWEDIIIKQALGYQYILLDIQYQSEELMRTSVIKLGKLKQKQSRLFYMDIINHNLTQISTFIDETLLPFKQLSNPLYANITNFYVVQKNNLVIVYQYCNQGTLLNYKKIYDFDDVMIDEINNMLKNVLGQWKGQYRFLSNQQVLINNGKPLLKYPPYPNQSLKNEINQAKNGKSFIAPQIGNGFQSLSADSWSFGVLEYWMRLNKLPQFDEKDQLIIQNRHELDIQKIKQLIDTIKKKPKERKNWFPADLKKQQIRFTSDSLSSSQSLSTKKHSLRIKSHSLDPKNLAIIPIREQLEDFNEIDQFQIESPRKDEQKQKIKQNNLSNLSKINRKRFPTFSGEIDIKEKAGQQKDRSEARDRRLSKIKQQSEQKLKRKLSKENMLSNLAISQAGPNQKKKMLDYIIKQGSKLSVIERHWTKPLRIVFKCIIALLIYIFLFYYSFLQINSNLMKNRFQYRPTTLNLRANDVSTLSSINFTIVTKNHQQAIFYNNQTLNVVRDTLKCITNDYSSNSNVFQVINSMEFTIYQIFGFIIIIINLICVCLTLAKLDLAKAITLIDFDDNFYVPFYAWLLINMAISSLTSFTYLLYGDLFALQLEPCISRPNHPSLTFIFKKMPSSFVWRFIWVYLGLIIAYILIIFLIKNPKYRLHRYLYIFIIFLYLGGIGARTLGTFNNSLLGLMGISGQLLSFLIGIPLFLIDILITCRMRKITNINHKQRLQTQYNITNQNLSLSLKK